MIRLNEMPLDYEPRRKILSRLPQLDGEPEMSEFDSAFLCGTLKTFHPKKILEVGVAGGATTAIILQTLEDIGTPYEMHSIDLAEKFYQDETLPSGALGMLAKEKIFGNLRGVHKFHLGKILPYVIDEIGGGIDFVILDTAHHLPGEILDFLAVLPYLTDNAVVVLHDVSLHHYEFPNWCNGYCTDVLLSAVTAEKFLNFQPEEELFGYPNIAAFRINEQTETNIENVFLALTLLWKYFPEKQIVIYREHYRRFYSDALCDIFQEAVDMNGYNLAKVQNN